MNGRITRISGVALALVVALIVATTYWQTWAAAGLADRQDNAIQRVAQFTIERGKIYAADGKTLLAANVAERVAGKTLYFRTYPWHRLAPHVVGYSTQSRSRAGLERSENDYLTGANTNLDTVFRTTLDRLRGATVQGNDLILTLDARAQRVANHALAGNCGAAVALDPRNGRVLVMASSPNYDPNLIERHFARAALAKGPCTPAAPLLDRATDGLYTPGSTFKLVTASAALDSGKFKPDSRFNDPGYCEEYGKRVSNAGAQDGSAEVFGNVTLAQGLQHSINSVFCNVGKAIGAGLILEYAKRFGFYSEPPLETPSSERAPSGLYRNGRPFAPRDPAHEVDPGRLAFGQERLLVTPLQNAMVAATVANHGIVMRPHVVDRIVSPAGKVVSRSRPEQLGRAIKPQTALELRDMMVAAVESGTGTAARIPGIQVAGKTGTAETGSSRRNTTWFLCFAPADAPKVAVAVVLENQTGYGGTTAAPIAKAVLQALLRLPANP